MGGGDSGHSTWDVGCDVVEVNGTKMGEKWERNVTKYPFFTVPFSPFFGRGQIFPTVPFVKTSSPHSPTEKWELLPLTDTQHHRG